MKKLLIAAAVGALSATMVATAADAAEQSTTTTTTTTHSKTEHHHVVKKARAPQPRRLIKRKPNPKKEARVDPVPVGSVKWTCEDGLSFDLKGDMKRDQIVTVHWNNKNYNLPRETTTTGADRFHDPASGLDLVVIPSKAMLLSDADDSRLADECKTDEMMQGAPAPTQSNALIKNPKN